MPINNGFAWVASEPALIILAIASMVEVLAYLVPFVDNLLDSIAVPLAAVAGTLVMAASVTDISPEMTWALAVIAGGGVATTIKGTSAVGRAVSTGTTAGVANPIISVGETGTAIGLSVMSVFVPVLAGIAGVLLFILVIWLMRKFK